MPSQGPRRPTQLTEVPVKTNCAREPTVAERAAVPLPVWNEVPL